MWCVPSSVFRVVHCVGSFSPQGEPFEAVSFTPAFKPLKGCSLRSYEWQPAPQLPSLCFPSHSFLDEHEADNEDVKSFWNLGIWSSPREKSQDTQEYFLFEHCSCFVEIVDSFLWQIFCFPYVCSLYFFSDRVSVCFYKNYNSSSCKAGPQLSFYLEMAYTTSLEDHCLILWKINYFEFSLSSKGAIITNWIFITQIGQRVRGFYRYCSLKYS